MCILLGVTLFQWDMNVEAKKKIPCFRINIIALEKIEMTKLTPGIRDLSYKDRLNAQNLHSSRKA